MVRARGKRKQPVRRVGVYSSRVKRANGKAVWQSARNQGTNRGLFKMSGGSKRGRNYIGKKYKKNVRRSGRPKGMPLMEADPSTRKKRKRRIKREK